MMMLIVRRHSNNTTLLKILQISLSLSLPELGTTMPVASCSRVQKSGLLKEKLETETEEIFANSLQAKMSIEEAILEVRKKKKGSAILRQYSVWTLGLD